MATDTPFKELGQALLDEGLIDEDQLKQARKLQASHEKSLGRALVELGFLTEEAKMAFLHKAFEYEIVDLSGLDVDPAILTRISYSFAEKHRCVPILIEDGHLVVAMENPTDVTVLDAVKTQTGMEPVAVIAPLEDIEAALRQYPRLSQYQADEVFDASRPPLWVRALHPVLFLIVMIAPLFLFAVLFTYSYDLSAYIMSAARVHSFFDIGLYVVLAWVLWAIFVWEIDSLIFKKRS